jgi:hypothetical protein
MTDAELSSLAPPIIAPQSDDAGLRVLSRLRATGRTCRVIWLRVVDLPDAERLVLSNGEWIIEGRQLS